MNNVEVGDVVDVDADEIAYQGVRVLELVPDVRQASGVIGDDGVHGRSFQGPGFLGKTEEGDLLFSLRQVVPGSKDRYYFGDSGLYDFNEAEREDMYEADMPAKLKVGDEVAVVHESDAGTWVIRQLEDSGRDGKMALIQVKGLKWYSNWKTFDEMPRGCSTVTVDKLRKVRKKKAAELEEKYDVAKLAEVIRRCGDKWCLFTKHKKNGKRRRLGTHGTRAGAENQEKAIKSHGG